MNTSTGSTGSATSKSAAPAASAPTASTAAPKRVVKGPRPKHTVTSRFHARLAKIFAGEVSKKDFLFEPLSPVNKKTQVVIGTVRDQKAREFFSLFFRLKTHNAPRVRAPRTPAELPRAEAELETIEGLAKTASNLGWQIVADQFPNEKRRNWELKQGWVVVRDKTFKEAAPEALAAAGIPSFMASELLARMPAELADHPVGDLIELLKEGGIEALLATGR
jgi:hypothetical protein